MYMKNGSKRMYKEKNNHGGLIKPENSSMDFNIKSLIKSAEEQIIGKI